MPVENEFEVLISSFISEKVGIANHFLSNELSANLRQNLVSLIEKKQLTKAGVGNEKKLLFDDSIRSDSIYWLDRKHDNEFENDFLDQIDDFIKYLNRSCFAGITGYEFHYSLYEIGGFYKRHIDQFQDNSSRKYSMISYLNDDWQKSDGGELVVYQTYNNKNIAPTKGKTVLFKSNELQHEVLVTQKQRMSITGWLKRDGLV
jgi:Rps23 Pro-64 3,4-dihydroxylase Tpa1-like proline 4-hydroxylase